MSKIKFREYITEDLPITPLVKGIIPTIGALIDPEWVHVPHDFVVGINNMAGKEIYQYPKQVRDELLEIEEGLEPFNGTEDEKYAKRDEIYFERKGVVG